MTRDIKTNISHCKRARSIRVLPLGPVLILCFGAAFGCSSESLDLGDQPLAVDRSALSSYADVWEGYAEAFRFDSGSDHVRLAVSAAGEGYLVFGDGEPPVPPTDPDHPFPPGQGGPFAGRPSLYEGFSYSLAGTHVEVERLRARGRSGEHYDAACAIQTPIEDLVNAGQFRCVPNLPGSLVSEDSCYQIDGEVQIPISCDRLSLCMLNRACECSASNCRGSDGEDIELDAAFDADASHLVGTLRVPFGTGSATVRLSRVSD